MAFNLSAVIEQANNAINAGEPKGNKYPIYISNSGSCYIIRRVTHFLDLLIGMNGLINRR